MGEEFKNHFRIAHRIAVLLAVVGDGNKAVAFGGLPDVFNGQGHIAVHGEADGGIGAEKPGEDGSEVLISFHCSNSFKVEETSGDERQRSPVEGHCSECPRTQSFAISAREDRASRSFRP